MKGSPHCTYNLATASCFGFWSATVAIKYPENVGLSCRQLRFCQGTGFSSAHAKYVKFQNSNGFKYARYHYLRTVGCASRNAFRKNSVQTQGTECMCWHMCTYVLAHGKCMLSLCLCDVTMGGARISGFTPRTFLFRELRGTLTQVKFPAIQ